MKEIKRKKRLVMKKRKKIMLLLTICVILVFKVPVFAAQTDPIEVFLNGNKIDFEDKVLNYNGMIWVPANELLETLGYEVFWEEEESLIIAVNSEENILFLTDINTQGVIVCPYSEYDNLSENEMKEYVQKTFINTPKVLYKTDSVAYLSILSLDGIIKYDISWNDNNQTLYIDKGEYQMLYASDGRQRYFKKSEVNDYLSLGWHIVPTKTLYHPDGRVQNFEGDNVQNMMNSGWYDIPVQMLYAADGRRQVFEKSAVPAQLTVGWYEEEPTQTLYLLDGSSQNFKVSEVATKLNEGWYIYPCTKIVCKTLGITTIIPNVLLENNVFMYDTEISSLELYDKIGLNYRRSYNGTISMACDVFELKYMNDFLINVYKNTYHADVDIISEVTSNETSEKEYLAMLRYWTYKDENIESPELLSMIEFIKTHTYPFIESECMDTTDLFSMDGRITNVSNEAVQDFLNVGWYKEPFRIVFNDNADMVFVPQSQYYEYLNKGYHGYYEEAFIDVYSSNGMTAIIKLSQKNDYLRSGWYTSPQKTFDQIGQSAYKYVQNYMKDYVVYYPDTAKFVPYREIYFSQYSNDNPNTFYLEFVFSAENSYGARVFSHRYAIVELTNSGFIMIAFGDADNS